MPSSKNLLSSILLATLLYACSMTEETNSSPRLSVDFRQLENEIIALTNAKWVRLEDFRTTKGDKVIKRELRIDLNRPDTFPGNDKLKQIILLVRSKLADASLFDTFTVAEVAPAKGEEDVVPAKTILRSYTIKAKDL
ncbi:MAG: hypothetical protein K0Q66_798 [Chitinophagaceae bacterium]|jgi:hypothetical protein|nr:hypothetical protein [Chitinophagaceae bacterium]